MTWSVQSLSSATPQAWKNGGGVTRELLVWPHAHDWRVRVSVAEIAADGPFSSFPGVKRWFAVLEGGGVVLQVNGTSTELNTNSSPFAFYGEASTQCTLVGGFTQDINLMLRGVGGRMQRVRGSHHAQSSATPMRPKLIGVYAVHEAGQLVVGQERLALPAHALAWRIVTESGDVGVTAGEAIWMEIEL